MIKIAQEIIMENQFMYITKEQYQEYRELLKYKRITSDKYHKIHRLISEALILIRSFDSNDMNFDEDDLQALLDKAIDELYICSLEYKETISNGILFKRHNNH